MVDVGTIHAQQFNDVGFNNTLIVENFYIITEAAGLGWEVLDEGNERDNVYANANKKVQENARQNLCDQQRLRPACTFTQ